MLSSSSVLMFCSTRQGETDFAGRIERAGTGSEGPAHGTGSCLKWKDRDLLVVAKPPGLPTTPLIGARVAPSLAEALAERYPELKGLKDLGACHRLDTETSGLVVFARNRETYEKMREAFSKNRVKKEYVALVEGIVTKGGKIDWPIGPDPKSAKRVKVYKNLKEARRGKAQEAVTVYEPITTTLLRIHIKTGRRHQIRAHLAAIGHPIVGDKLYGGPAAERLHLYATGLEFDHPKRGRRVKVSFEASQGFLALRGS